MCASCTSISIAMTKLRIQLVVILPAMLLMMSATMYIDQVVDDFAPHMFVYHNVFGAITLQQRMYMSQFCWYVHTIMAHRLLCFTTIFTIRPTQAVDLCRFVRMFVLYAIYLSIVRKCVSLECPKSTLPQHIQIRQRISLHVRANHSMRHKVYAHIKQTNAAFIAERTVQCVYSNRPTMSPTIATSYWC